MYTYVHACEARRVWDCVGAGGCEMGRCVRGGPGGAEEEMGAEEPTWAGAGEPGAGGGGEVNQRANGAC